jgi:hypothetical protein
MVPDRWKRLFDNWLLTSQAAKLLLASTILVLGMTPIFQGKVDLAGMSLWMRVFWTLFGMLGTLALFVLWLGMWRYWAMCNKSRSPEQWLWFLVMLIGVWYGSCLYCYFVYLPQIVRQRKGT